MEIIAETANLWTVGALFGPMFATLGLSESICCSIISFFVFERWSIVLTESIACSKEIFHRVQNLESPIPSAISGPSQEGIRKEKVRRSKNCLSTLAGDRTFCLLTSAECIYAILASNNCGMSTRGFFAAWKIGPPGDRVQVARRIEDGSVTEITGIGWHQLLSIFKPTHLELRLLQWLL